MGLKTKLLAIIGIIFIFLNHNWKNDKETKKQRAPVKKITIGNRAITGLSQQYFVYHLAHFLVSLQSIIHFRFVRIISFSPSFCYYPTICVCCITVLFKKRLSKLFSKIFTVCWLLWFTSQIFVLSFWTAYARYASRIFYLYSSCFFIHPLFLSEFIAGLLQSFQSLDLGYMSLLHILQRILKIFLFILNIL